MDPNPALRVYFQPLLYQVHAATKKPIKSGFLDAGGPGSLTLTVWEKISRMGRRDARLKSIISFRKTEQNLKYSNTKNKGPTYVFFLSFGLRK